MDSQAPFEVWYNDMYNKGTIKDSGFTKWLDSLDDATVQSMSASQALESYKASLVSTSSEAGTAATVTSKLTSGLKGIAGTIGSSLLNFGASMAVMAAITLAVKGIDYLIHYQDKLIEKGEKAKETISNAYHTNGTIVITGSVDILISMIPSSFMKQLKSNVFDRKES